MFTYLCVRTTIDMPDALFRHAKQVAAEQGTTLRDLVVSALEVRLRTSPQPFRLRPAAVGTVSEDSSAVSAMTINEAIERQRETPFRP